jgi:tRNA splicing ligase
MLEVQKYLLSGKTLEDLNAELGINATLHPNPAVPLVILNYDQIESRQKTHPIVRECRALTLDSRSWNVVAKSFNRFFNWGEVQDEQKLFNFSNFTVQSKEDGSLCSLYNFEGNWYANTRASFGLDNVQGSPYTWRQLFCKALGVSDLNDLGLNPSITYVAEFCSLYNKVVRKYHEPVMYLLTAFDNKTLQEFAPVAVDGLVSKDSSTIYFRRPLRYEFKSIEEIQEFLKTQAKNDPTYEGVVICDNNFNRWKIKSLSYLELHLMRGEGDNRFHPKYLLPRVLDGDEEFLTYYEETKETYMDVKCKVLEAYIKMLETWVEYKDIESQKEFAQTIIGKTPFTGILFNVRKKGKEQKLDDLKQEWREAESMILKAVFGR